MHRLLAIALICTAGTAACAQKATTIITGPLTLAVGASAQYTATVNGTSAGPTAPASQYVIQWESANPAVATTTIDGLVTGVAPGKVILRAKLMEYSMSSAGQLEITVVQ